MKEPSPSLRSEIGRERGDKDRLSVLGLSLLQGVAFALATAMCVEAKLPWPGIASLVLLGIFSVAGRLGDKGANLNTAAGAVCTVALLITVLISGAKSSTLGTYLDSYYAVTVGLVAAGVALSRRPAAAESLRLQDLLGIIWAGLAVVLWLAVAYVTNAKSSFYLGMVAATSLAALCQWHFRPKGIGFYMLNCFIFLIVGLGVADFFVQPAYQLDASAAVRRSYYSYEGARRDPTAFAQWWSAYLAQWALAEKELYVPDPEGYLPYRLRPGGQAMLFQSRIQINSRGFRGKEFSERKGDAYRILVLGESTTFGITLNADDRPWPELLEELIEKRLKPARRVEVINAGVPGYHLQNNIERLQLELLSLKPDLVISYHGLNGFPMLHGALPSTRAAGTAPTYRERPLRVLANCEYKLRVAQFRQRQTGALRRDELSVADPMKTPCAQAYRRLCEIADTNQVRLVLASFSMAVNSGSPLEAVEFYQASYPATPWNIPVNALHTRILQQVVKEYPGTLLVNTAPGLDGVPEHFLDLVHFSPSGERQLAETMFAGIEKLLRSDLERTPVAEQP